MGTKKYTVLVFSQQASRVKKFILSPLALKVGAAGLLAFLAGSAYLAYDYVTYQKKILDIKELRTEISTQQAEIQSFLEKISVLEEQLSRIKVVEEQVKKDLKEVQELKKERKVKKTSPRPVSSAKKPEPSQAESKTESTTSRRNDVSTLDAERPRLVSRLHLEIQELSREARARENTLNELREFLQAQKSILLAIPSLWPVMGKITSPFGDARVNQSSGGIRSHMGVDIGAAMGTPIIAPADGIVASAGREAEYGRLVCLDHGHGFATMFGHLSQIYVRAGEAVKAGQILGTVGTSGSTTGPHLHYEIKVYGRPVNPFSYLIRTS